MKLLKLLSLLVIMPLFSCSVDEQLQSKTQLREANASGHIGDPSKTPDLYIPESEANWQYMYGGLGLRTADEYLVSRGSDNKNKLNYPCWIANKLPASPSEYYTGQHDFVVNMEQDGIYNSSSNSYDFPGMLSITTFQNGLPIAHTEKQRFYVIPSDFRNEIDPTRIIIYGEEFMAIQAGTSDNYDNKAEVREGKNLIVVEVNPDGLITERDMTNNVSTLPVNVTFEPINGNVVGHAVVDLSAIGANKTIPPSGLVFTRTKVRNTTEVFLDWGCPYHMPIYVKHWFTVKRNGVIISPIGLDESQFLDKVNGNPQTIIYTITTTVVGLGESAPVQVTVTR